MALTNPTTGSQNKVAEQNVAKSNELNEQYIDKRSITITPVHNYSNYRRVNMKVMGQKREVIGASYHSCQILSSNAAECGAYFPQIIGVAANNADFITRVKEYLSNIHVVMTEENMVFNTSFIYNKKSDYLKVQKEEDAINEAYEAVDRSNLKLLKEALKRKIDALNALESSKYQYGKPENIEEYLIYRHCLLYKDVAKDVAFINGDPDIRFYIKDEAKEAERAKKLTNEKLKAMKTFLELNGDDTKFDAVYIAVCMSRNDIISEALLKDKTQKTAIVMNFVNDSPSKFNKIAGDKNIKMKAFIEKLIARGELVRSEYNQQISTADGTFVGANLNDAVIYFENPENSALRTAFENKLKLS